MKCPECGNNHKRSLGQKCACGYEFVFNPAVEHGLTDGRFLAIARKASANDTYYFTFPQFYAAFCKRQRMTKGALAMAVIPAVLFMAVGSFLLIQPASILPLPLPAVGCFIGLIILIAAVVSYRKAPPHPDIVQGMVEKWLRTRTLPKLLQKPSLHKPPPQWKEHDIYDYGVERILVVERDILVDWFVLNNFHAQERTLVIAESGYPTYLAPVADKMLRENPNLPIYLLHDAGIDGQGMAARISQKPLLAKHAAVDLGLFPDDVKALKRMNFMRLAHDDYRMPVDYLPYAAIAPAVGAAMASNMTFAQLIAANQGPDGGPGDSGGPSSFG